MDSFLIYGGGGGGGGGDLITVYGCIEIQCAQSSDGARAVRGGFGGGGGSVLEGGRAEGRCVCVLGGGGGGQSSEGGRAVRGGVLHVLHVTSSSCLTSLFNQFNGLGHFPSLSNTAHLLASRPGIGEEVWSGCQWVANAKLALYN